MSGPGRPWRRNTTRHNTTQHNTTQHNTTHHNSNAGQHNTTQHNTTQHNTPRTVARTSIRTHLAGVVHLDPRADLDRRVVDGVEGVRDVVDGLRPAARLTAAAASGGRRSLRGWRDRDGGRRLLPRPRCRLVPRTHARTRGQREIAGHEREAPLTTGRSCTSCQRPLTGDSGEPFHLYTDARTVVMLPLTVLLGRYTPVLTYDAPK